MTPTWSAEWPTEPGFYWFYGYRSRHKYAEPELMLVKVIQASNSVIMTANGHFFFQSEAGNGLWTPAVVPSLPSLEKES